MKKFFWLILLLLIPGMLARINFGGAGILASDILLPLFSLLWLGQKVIKNEKFPRNNWIGLGFLFLSWAFISWLLGAWDLGFKEKFLSFSYLVRLFSFLIFGWATMDIWGNTASNHTSPFSNQKQSPKFFRPPFFLNSSGDFFAGFFLISGIIILLGFLQFFLVPDIAKYSTEGGWDPHMGRLLGTWLDPNYLAGFLGFLLPISIAKWYDQKLPLPRGEGWGEGLKIPPTPFVKGELKGKIPRIFLALLIIASFVALFLTFSRSGYLAAGIGLLIFFLVKDWKVILIAIILASIGIVSSERATKRVEELAGTFASIVFQDTDEIDPTAKLRIQNWGKSFSLFEKKKIAGIGYNTYRYIAAEEGIVNEGYFSAGGADSTHLTILVTTGLIGFFLYLLFLGNLLRISWRKSRSAPQGGGEKNGTIYLGFFAGLCALLIHATFVNSLFFPLIFIPVMAVWGIISRDSAQ